MAAPGNALEGRLAMHRGWKAHVAPFVAGAITFAATEWWLLTASPGSGTSDPGWFLNGRESGLAVTAAIGLLAAVLATVRRSGWLSGAAACAAGAAVAMTLVLFLIGPGAIFPIVIAFGTVVLAGSALIGTGLGWLLRTAWSIRDQPAADRTDA
jgi:hypothetical protein